MSSPEPRRPRAGIAFIDAVAGDPAAEAALERARDRLRLFAKAAEPLRACRAIVAEAMEAMTAELGRVRREADAERAEALRLVAEVVRGALDDANSQLSLRGFDAPGSDLEAWGRLARIVEREPSNMTLAEIFDWAIAWSDREKLRIRIAASVKAETGPADESAVLQRLRALLGPATSPQAPMPVALANAGEVVAAFQEALTPPIEAALPGRGEPHGDAAPGEGVSWKEAMSAAEAHVRKHGGFFPGRNELARLVGCSPSTMTKAIRRSTYLRARAEESKSARIREVQLGTPIERGPADDDAAPQRSDLAEGESDPAADQVEAYHAGGDDEDERDVVTRKLAAQQHAELMREERQRRRAAKDGKLK